MSNEWVKAYVHTQCKEIHRGFLVISRENALEVNAEKPKYMFLSREHKARKTHNTK